MQDHTPEFIQPQLPFEDIRYCACGCGKPLSKPRRPCEQRKFIRGHNGRINNSAEYFWSRVKIGAPDECWEWQGARTNGYGRLRHDNKTQLAHRVGWELEHGPIPDGLQVCHHCDNPSCNNPAHWFLGTHADNHADKMAKGRESRGEKRYNAKLAEVDVIKIRRLYREGVTQTALAAQYGLDQGHVSDIVNYKRWKHVR